MGKSKSKSPAKMVPNDVGSVNMAPELKGHMLVNIINEFQPLIDAVYMETSDKLKSEFVLYLRKIFDDRDFPDVPKDFLIPVREFKLEGLYKAGGKVHKLNLVDPRSALSSTDRFWNKVNLSSLHREASDGQYDWCAYRIAIEWPNSAPLWPVHFYDRITKFVGKEHRNRFHAYQSSLGCDGDKHVHIKVIASIDVGLTPGIADMIGVFNDRMGRLVESRGVLIDSVIKSRERSVGSFFDKHPMLWRFVDDDARKFLCGCKVIDDKDLNSALSVLADG